MRTGTILVVDDEVDVLEMIEVGLTSRGYELLLAESGERALEVFDRQRPDLVICDLKMPGMGGIATITRLRQLAPELPVIVLSGYLGPSALEDCARLGASTVLRKPFLFRELSAAVKQALALDR